MFRERRIAKSTKILKRIKYLYTFNVTNFKMPRLRKQSTLQRSQSIRQSLRRYREQNLDSDRLRNSQMLASTRQNEEYREAERERDNITHASRRRNPLVRSGDRRQDALQHSVRRLDEDYRQTERERDTLLHARDRLQDSVRRLDEEYRQIEQERYTMEHILRRDNDEYRRQERERDTLQHAEYMKNTGLSNQSATLSSTRYAERMKNTDNKKGYKTHFNMLFGEWMKNTGLSNNSATPSSTLYAGKMKNTDKVNESEMHCSIHKGGKTFISEHGSSSVRSSSSEEVPFISNTGDQELVQRLIQDNSDADDVTELNPQETLIDNDPIENMPLSRIAIAPGEGQRPLDLILDKDSEELSFPSIYCGVKRTSTATIGKVIKSEARRYDRQWSRVDKVLYSYKKLELSKIKSNISTCLRKKIGHSSYTARDVLDDNFVQNLIQHDEGYHILKGIRSSPAHWEGEKKKVLAMIRQFGLPTFFITLSAAESQWPELLNSFPAVTNFINRFISTDSTIDDAKDYITYQQHNHSRSCQREIRGRKYCRFGIPHPPLLNTEILLPFPEDISPDETRRHINNFENIQDLLNAKLTSLEKEELNSFERFLSERRINISYEDYILRTTSFRNQFVIPDIKKERTTILKMKLTMPMKLEFPFG
ncbi:hypothetical protein CVS40_11887 [Lucilia cuprina]|nr:hypothetical protein CVS40_11887 [Lucilia cuprina]